MISTRRVYDHSACDQSGQVFLVDRVWPRGITKDALCDAVWMKEVAPSTSLRKWFSHDPAKWQGFLTKYFKELDAKPDTWQPILKAAKKHAVTLLYSAKDEEHNQAVALRAYLDKRLKHSRAS